MMAIPFYLCHDCATEILCVFEIFVRRLRKQKSLQLIETVDFMPFKGNFLPKPTILFIGL